MTPRASVLAGGLSIKKAESYYLPVFEAKVSKDMIGDVIDSSGYGECENPPPVLV